MVAIVTIVIERIVYICFIAIIVLERRIVKIAIHQHEGLGSRIFGWH